MLRALSPDAVRDALLAALESAGIGCTVVLVKEDGLERVYANEAFARILRVDVETARRLPALLSLRPDQRERLERLRQEGGDGLRPLALDTVMVRPDGSEVPVHVGLAMVPLGEVRASFAFLRDISAEAEMSAALRESEERFRSVAETCPDSITVVRGGRIVYANPVALRLMGLSTLEELSGVDPLSLAPPDHREATAAYLARIATGECPPPLEIRAVYPDGRVKVFESSMRATTLHGEPAVVSYSREITERLALHAELAKRDRLASVGLLASGVAHELNNPLTALAIQARKLREELARLDVPSELVESAALVDEAAARMREIIGALLFTSRTVEHPQTWVDVGQILSSTIALVRASGVELPVQVALGKLPPVQGYASKLGQVFLNVLRNAADAVRGRPDGAIGVRGELEGDAIAIVFEDNGPGIPAAVLARVAQPFFTTKAQGVGLGLWISQTLMAEQGGALDVESTEGVGTKVTVRIPLGVDAGGGI
jgi:PAS domain S-box-containing protein